MKKLILTAGLAALLMGSASAAEPTTLTDKADKLDEVIFGEVQQGSFLERVSTMDEAVYGGTGEERAGRPRLRSVPGCHPRRELVPAVAVHAGEYAGILSHR